jgi:hypothetical protein
MSHRLFHFSLVFQVKVIFAACVDAVCSGGEGTNREQDHKHEEEDCREFHGVA